MTRRLPKRWCAAALLSLSLPGLATAQQFSLDLGSDKEISDPFGGAGELLDPGDVYLSSPIPGSTAVPLINDAGLFFGVDPWPVQGAPATACSVGSNVFGRCFDLDGLDLLDFRVSSLDIGSVIRPDQVGLTQCVNPTRFLAISLDDDGPEGMDQPIPPRAPTEDVPNRGSAAGNDELLGVTRLGGFVVVAPIASERAVHADLSPNPLPQGQDDDVDALDLAPDLCEVVYFSADDEANLAGTINLIPGAIYQVVPGAVNSPIAVVRPADLGLPPRTDIDAFEFVWLPVSDVPTPTPSIALAVIFSVDQDRPSTAADESGGLNPGAVYASFMTGTNFRLIPAAALPPSDIDALAASREDLTLGLDSDNDGLSDSQDNCIRVANPNQVDADGDRIGNMCDPDFNMDCRVNFIDLSLFYPQFFGTNPVFDLNVDGFVNFGDLQIVNTYFFGPPGPSPFACP